MALLYLSHVPHIDGALIECDVGNAAAVVLGPVRVIDRVVTLDLAGGPSCAAPFQLRVALHQFQDAHRRSRIAAVFEANERRAVVELVKDVEIETGRTERKQREIGLFVFFHEEGLGFEHGVG